MSRNTAAHLAHHVRELRRARGLTQQQMAALAGIPRPTWAHLESGAANPTLTVLTRVATALQVRVEELLAPPKPGARLYRAQELDVRKRGHVEVRKLLPENVSGLDIERLKLSPGAAMTGIPHTAGTREYLTCERGRIEVRMGGQRFRLAPGDVVAFRGDQKHGYRNPSRSVAVAYSVVAYAPVTGSD